MTVLGTMVGNGWRTTRNIAFVLVLLVSLAMNVASFTVNTVSTAISMLFEAVTGVDTVVSTARKATQSAIKLEAGLAEKTVALETERAAKVAAQAEKATLQTELRAATKEVSVLRGTAAGHKVALESMQTEKLALEAERTALRSKVASLAVFQSGVKDGAVKDGAVKDVPKLVSEITTRVRNRTVKLATADFAATAGQAIPWIGIGVVVAATAYDLDMSCQTMSDMKALDQVVNPSAADEADVSLVCGLKVPTAEQVWEEVKASPGQAWNAAASVLSGLLSVMPDLPAWWGYVVSIDWTPWN